MAAIIAWFQASKLAEWLAAIVAGLAVVGAILAKAFYSGKAAQQNADTQATLKSVEVQNETQQSVDKMSPDAVRNELHDWESK